MANQLFKLNETSSANAYSGSKTYAMQPNLEDVVVLIKKSSDETELPKTNYTFQYNKTSGVVSVTFNAIPATAPAQSQTETFLNLSDHGGENLSCNYTGYKSLPIKRGGGSCPPYFTWNTSAKFVYDVVVAYETNRAPTITLTTTDGRTLYENDTYNLTGMYNDADIGNVISVKYSINNGIVRALTSAISDGVAKTFNRVLSYKNNKLFDGETSLTDTLAEGAQHVVKVWAEDDKGGKSQEQLRILYVVANRAPVLKVNPFAVVADLINSDKVTISGTVSDPDGNTVKVEYKIGSGSFTEILSGQGGSWSFEVPLTRLQDNDNAVAIRSTDSYGAITTRNIKVTKKEVTTPLMQTVQRYKINPPNREAQGVLLWIERETGDLAVSVEISMTNGAEDEFFQPMEKTSTGYVRPGIEEDEFVFDAEESKDNIVIKITNTRTDATSNKNITLISGVLS